MPNLVPCPNCQNPVSSLANACPKCGDSLSPAGAPAATPLSKHPGLLRGVGLAVVLIALFKIAPLISHATSNLGSTTTVSAAAKAPEHVRLVATDLGRHWPFTVNEVLVSCRPNPRHPDSPFLLAATAGKTYYLTWLPADSGADRFGWSSADDIRKVDPATNTQIDLQPVIDRASQLCH